MTAKKALLTVLLWGVVFSIAGGAVGAALGIAVPDYYRSVLRDGRSPDFDPLEAGVGLGVTQGFAAGVVSGLAVLVIFAWRDVYSNPVGGADVQRSDERKPGRWTRIALVGTSVALSVTVFSVVAFILGGIVGQQQLYHSWTDQKLRKLDTILASQEFPDVRTGYSSAAQVFLVGTVEDEAVRRRLHESLIDAFGTEEAEQMLLQVEVERRPEVAEFD